MPSELKRNTAPLVACIDAVLNDIRAASSVYRSSGRIKYIPYAKDNLVLEVAFAGSCTVLVTGDRKHLLPLSPFHGLILEPPAAFLKRLP